MSANIVTNNPVAEISPLVRAKIDMLRATLDESDRERRANCKIAKHMRQQGFPPESGYILFLTAATADAAGVNVAALPPYCRISHVLTAPKVALNPTELEIQALCGKPTANGG